MYRFLPVALCPCLWMSTPPQVGHSTASNTILFSYLFVTNVIILSNKCDTLPPPWRSANGRLAMKMAVKEIFGLSI